MPSHKGPSHHPQPRPAQLICAAAPGMATPAALISLTHNCKNIYIIEGGGREREIIHMQVREKQLDNLKIRKNSHCFV